MRLRSYQDTAVANVHGQFLETDSTLVVLPTGCGKTVLFSEVIRRENRRALVIAHREELIWQARDKLRRITGEEPEIEMAEFKASATNLYGKNKVVIATVQTLNAGKGENGRMGYFNPDDFGLLVIDEAHHAVASSYRAVINYFRQNKALKVLGVTATPDRTDEEALGQIFQTVAFNYEIVEAIHDGWLVPIVTQAVAVEGLDLSSVRTTAGDLNGADLARVMEYEETLHRIAHPTFDLIGQKKALVFAASVAHAERLAEIFNRHEPGCANWLCGETPKDDRRRLFADYTQRKFRILVNVGVATEGFDDPGIEVIVMGRPTKSRSLYAQMAGRGTRPLPGIVDRHDISEGLLWGPTHRCAAIAASAKPSVLILDFVGNSGKHKLVTAADILGGNYSDEVVAQAKQKVEEAGKQVNMLEALAEAEEEERRERERQRQAEESRRAAVKVKAKYATVPMDAFDVFGIAAPREHGWDKGRQPSENMLAMLQRQGIDTDGITYAQASKLIGEVTRRWDQKLATLKMVKLLGRYGIDAAQMGMEEAKGHIDAIAANGWKKTHTNNQEAMASIRRY